MAHDRSYIAENTHERKRLSALVAKLSDGDLARTLPAGWTVAAVLGHLAFWDQRIIALLPRLERGETIGPIEERDVDWINDAAKPMLLAIPPRRMAELAVAIADAVDDKVATLGEATLARALAVGPALSLRRAEHRRTHLDEIERALEL
ncbi:MAG TPA: maleylpyruvate isomerase N-terminal domain-containing protein [Methylomirabilota bacterium]|jgi:uncharacterized damage-inducible protein DinB